MVHRTGAKSNTALAVFDTLNAPMLVVFCTPAHQSAAFLAHSTCLALDSLIRREAKQTSIITL